MIDVSTPKRLEAPPGHLFCLRKRDNMQMLQDFRRSCLVPELRIFKLCGDPSGIEAETIGYSQCITVLLGRPDRFIIKPDRFRKKQLTHDGCDE